MENTLFFPLKLLGNELTQDLKKAYPNGWVGVYPNVSHLADVLIEATFWKITDKFDWTQYEEEDIMRPAVTYLSTCTVPQIQGFIPRLDLQLKILDKALPDIKARFLEDTFYGELNFLYYCCGVISRGQEYFEKVRQKPTWGWGARQFTFQPLLTLADQAYALKTGLPDLRYSVVG